jgi:hypothetical protein
MQHMSFFALFCMHCQYADLSIFFMPVCPVFQVFRFHALHDNIVARAVVGQEIGEFYAQGIKLRLDYSHSFSRRISSLFDNNPLAEILSPVGDKCCQI